MGLIILHRAHPSMPPAPLTAASLTASKTSTFGNEIGRIAAGIASVEQNIEVDPGKAGALIESSFALFVAGIMVRIATDFLN